MHVSIELQEKACKPDWLKRELPAGDNYTRIKGKLRELKLSTVRPVRWETECSSFMYPWLYHCRCRQPISLPRHAALRQ